MAIRFFAATLLVALLWPGGQVKSQTDTKRAMWLQIRRELTSENADAYFTAEMKGMGCPRLEGTLISVEDGHLILGLTDSVNREVRLVLRDRNGKDTALADVPQRGTPIGFQGVFVAFVRNPFMLTIDVPLTYVSLDGN